MRVVHLTSVHSRYDVRIFVKECRSLAAAGFAVTLIVADGMEEEICDGVHIVSARKPVGRADRMLCTVNHVFKIAADLRGDVYHLHDPELLRIAGRLRRVGRGAHVIFDAHEDLPRQILSKQWIPALLRNSASWGMEIIENHVVRRLSGVVTATPHIGERFRRINACVAEINNFPIPDELVSNERMLVTHQRQICYIGGITRARGIESLIKALPMVPNVSLVLCGRFQEAVFEAEMRSLPGWTQVDYRGQLDRPNIMKVLAESSAGIVTLFPTPAYVDALPVKMFEYMSAELPVIASDFPLWKRIIDESGAGICVDPESPDAIAMAIRFLVNAPVEAERMGKAGRKAVLEQYNWPTEAKKMVAFYEGLQ